MTQPGIVGTIGEFDSMAENIAAYLERLEMNNNVNGIADDKRVSALLTERVLEKVLNTNWVAPIVAVPKKDGEPRICGDYKVNVNQCLEVDQYPLPCPEELFITLGKHFTTLDLSFAYNQLSLHKDS